MPLNKLGRYDLIRVLGKGAMGLVYEGRDPNLDRRVAIKTIKVENLSEEAAAEYEVRFRTEARSAARLQHPNIVSVYDSDRDGDIAFLVMEFIQGDDLKHHLDKGDRHTLEQTLGIMSDLLSALDYAHRQNIVHRDIKPANLLIEANGRVKLTDFGVARIQDSGDATRTQGSMVGTLKYMSPEQVQGQQIDSRADLFAAGIVLYQLLTGKRPFDGDSDFAIIQQIVAQDPAPPSRFNPKLPPAMDAVVARALAKSREQRFANGHEFAAALQAAAGEASDPTAIAPAGPSVSTKSSTWTRTMRAGESLVDTQSGTGTNGSAVAQELELVYWKDVKDSAEVEDLQGFLDRFPTGIYTDLARRRLKKLRSPSGEDSGLGSKSGIGPLDKTMLMSPTGSSSAALPVGGTVDPAWNALGAAADRVPTLLSMEAAPEAPPETVASAPPADPVSSPPPVAPLSPEATVFTPLSPPVPIAAPASRRLAWMLAAIVALVGAGIVANRMSASDATAVQSAAPEATGAIAPALAVVASSPAGQAPPAGPAIAAAPAQPAQSVQAPQTARVARPAAPIAASGSAATVAIGAPTSAANEAALAAKKAASEKDRLAKLAPAKVETSVAAPGLTRVERVVPASISPAVAVANPRQACEGRAFLGFQSCMAEQCAKPAFAGSAECVERHAMEQRRRDAEQSRR